MHIEMMVFRMERLTWIQKIPQVPMVFTNLLGFRSFVEQLHTNFKYFDNCFMTKSIRLVFRGVATPLEWCVNGDCEQHQQHRIQ